ncbi:DUF1573 domain-containing protein [Sphingobacterium sp. LRF_L2]|uniref:DUF1573 domain-containing protein n=1 Tax=Sphingobacterium sp. LRF_L2 TaxID=3369421 RepID=UPI003F5E9C7A
MNIFKTSLVCLAVAILSSCGGSGEQQNDATDSTAVVKGENDGIGKIEFTESAFDFGQVKEGEVVEHSYEFKNTGTSPLILKQVSASCGCTTPSYTKAPILPGKTGEVKVSFNSDGQVGKQQKIVTVVSNAENGVTTVQLKGEVLAK